MDTYKFWEKASDLSKKENLIKNKKVLIEQLDEKIAKSIGVRERACATLPVHEKQFTDGLTRLKENYPKYEPSLIREVKIAGNPEKKERATRHLNDIRRMLSLPPMDFENASDDPKID